MKKHPSDLKKPRTIWELIKQLKLFIPLEHDDVLRRLDKIGKDAVYQPPECHNELVWRVHCVVMTLVGFDETNPEHAKLFKVQLSAEPSDNWKAALLSTMSGQSISGMIEQGLFLMPKELP